jgi:hypothetical protein
VPVLRCRPFKGRIDVISERLNILRNDRNQEYAGKQYIAGRLSPNRLPVKTTINKVSDHS